MIGTLDDIPKMTDWRACCREDLVGAALLELKEKHNINREGLFIQTKYLCTWIIVYFLCLTPSIGLLQ